LAINAQIPGHAIPGVRPAHDAWQCALGGFGQLAQPETGQILVKIRNLDEDQPRTGRMTVKQS
jgi:hypothetical protein